MNLKDNCSFDISHYKACLEFAKDNGYKFATMGNCLNPENKEGKLIIIRHDIDHYFELSKNFLDVENELGIKSTYFIRCHARYNPMFASNYNILKEMKENGHEIGLHHDCDFARLSNEDEKEFLKRDKKILELITNQEIKGISSHLPNKSKFRISDEEISEFGFKYQAYSDTFTKEMKYISDSGSRWREGCMCKFITEDVPRLCILTHPIWWHKESPLQNY